MGEAAAGGGCSGRGGGGLLGRKVKTNGGLVVEVPESRGRKTPLAPNVSCRMAMQASRKFSKSQR